MREPRNALAHRAQAVAARGLGERSAAVRLPDACLADDDHVVLLADPLARGELAHDGLVEASAGLAPDVLEARVFDHEVRGAQQSSEPAVVALGPLAIDHDGDLLGERAPVAGRLREEVAIGLGHRRELEVEQLLDGFVVGHDGSVSFRS